MTPAPVRRIGSRNATFQQWQALLENRTKRNRQREFLVQGVRPLTQAVAQGWPLRALLRADGDLSSWAAGIWESARADARVVLPQDLLAELGGKDRGGTKELGGKESGGKESGGKGPRGTQESGGKGPRGTQESAPELVAVLPLPADDLDRLLDPGRVPLVTVFDRPASPGNLGTLVRSVDAFGGTGVVVTGHAADPYDPRCVRASTGSLLSVPVVRAPSHAVVLSWVRAAAGGDWTVLGLDEDGDLPLADADFTGPTLLVLGNETRGLTRAWREACDHIVAIPMVGSASSLNAAVAGSVVLHQALRQREN